MSGRSAMTGLKPRVSIGLPVYNGELYLAKSIESILEQTFRDFELIISDNGSTDSTSKICQHFATLDHRVRYYRSDENLGCAWNYNRVFELARGEYFKWIADDDIHLPTFLAEAVAVLDQHPEVLWCFCRHVHIGPDDRVLTGSGGRAVSFLNPSGWDRMSPKPHQRFQSVLLSHSGLDIYALHRRDIVARTGVYQPHYGSEKVFLGELALLGKYHEIPQALFHLRVHSKASGSLYTDAELQHYIDPRVQYRFVFMRLRLLRAHWTAIHRFKLGFVERIRCYLALMRYLCQVSKWRHVFVSSWRRQGTGGGYHDFLKAMEQEAHEKAKKEIEITSTRTKKSPIVATKLREHVSEDIQCES